MSYLAQHFEGWKAPAPFEKGQLERLLMKGCNIGDVGARMLLGSEILSGLRELDLGACRLQPSTLEALRNSPHLTGLTSLGLAGNNPLESALAALGGWSVLPKLERLLLPQVISASELRQLFPSPSKNLRVLEFASAKGLAKSPDAILQCADSFTELNLGTTSIGDKGWAELFSAPCVESLRELHANGCSLSDESIAVLTKSKLRGLGTLDLSSNKLTDASLEALGQWPGLTHVTHLRIGNNRKLTAAGFDALIDAAHFAPVTLDLGKVNDAMLIARLRERFPGAV